MSELAAPRETDQSRRPRIRPRDPNDIFEILELSRELVCFLSGPDLRVEFANAAFTRLIGADVVGARAQQILIENPGLFKLIQQVYNSGQTQEIRETEV